MWGQCRHLLENHVTLAAVALAKAPWVWMSRRKILLSDLWKGLASVAMYEWMLGKRLCMLDLSASFLTYNCNKRNNMCARMLGAWRALQARLVHDELDDDCIWLASLRQLYGFNCALPVLQCSSVYIHLVAFILCAQAWDSRFVNCFCRGVDQPGLADFARRFKVIGILIRQSDMYTCMTARLSTGLLSERSCCSSQRTRSK